MYVRSVNLLFRGAKSSKFSGLILFTKNFTYHPHLSWHKLGR